MGEIKIRFVFFHVFCRNTKHETEIVNFPDNNSSRSPPIDGPSPIVVDAAIMCKKLTTLERNAFYCNGNDDSEKNIEPSKRPSHGRSSDMVGQNESRGHRLLTHVLLLFRMCLISKRRVSRHLHFILLIFRLVVRNPSSKIKFNKF